jgi:hypothetical protein
LALQSGAEPRFFINASTGEPHIYDHNVTEAEVEDVLARPIEDRPGSEGSRVAVADRGRAVSERHQTRTEEVMKQSKYPAGWDEARVKRVLAHYEQQSDDEAVAEDEAAYESTTHT